MKGEFLGYIMNKMISGGISGAITDETSAEAQKSAIIDYEKIRNDKYDIEKIAKNTGYSELQIKIIKNYLFYDKHKIEDNTIERFNPSFYISQSWKRLRDEPNNIQEHDLLLLKHESLEISLVMQGYDQDEAHNITEEKYNYKKMGDEYYEKLRNLQKRQHKQTPLNWKILKALDEMVAKANAREDKRMSKKGGK